MDTFKSFNNKEIDWKTISLLWYNYIERNNNELDYDQEFDFLRKSLNDKSLPWKDIQNDYYDMVERENNEVDEEYKFKYFKKLVNSHVVINKMK